MTGAPAIPDLTGAVKVKKSVSVLIPCRNEVDAIDACIANVFAFDEPDGGYEVIVVDGMSDDGTRERLERLKAKHENLTVIDNPDRFVPHAMNLGIRRANGDVIVRVDARCVHPRNYLVELLSLRRATKADNVGGVLHPRGNTYVQKAIACAYRSAIAVGGALRDRGDFVGENDTVYGGCFLKERLIEVGMYDESMVRNQDDELSFRIRKNGGRIFQSGGIRVEYSPRKRIRQLFKQFLQYGFWKTVVIRKHPRQASARHFVPSLFVAALAALAAAAVVDGRVRPLLIAFVGLYVLAVSLESMRVCRGESPGLWPGVALAIASMHLGYGTGFLAGVAGNALGMRRTWFTTLSR